MVVSTLCELILLLSVRYEVGRLVGVVCPLHGDLLKPV